jgi:signal transduction histidine kinase
MNLPVVSTLEELERVFDASGLCGPRDEGSRAYARALAISTSRQGTAEAGTAAAVAFAVEMLSALAVDLAARPARCVALVDEVERVCHAPRLLLGRGVLRSPSLLQLPSAIALEVQLTLLLAFTKASAVSLWSLEPSSRHLRHLAHAGEFNLRALHTRQVARRLLLRDNFAQYREGAAVGVVIDEFGGQRVALVARGAPYPAESLSLLEAAIPVLSAALARDELLGRQERRTRPKSGSSAESKLSQLRFDLHDGPQQDVIVLADDVRLFRSQLASAINEHPAKQRLVGRVDDLVARLVALDGDLRRIGAALAAPFEQADPLIDVLLTLTEAFATRTGIEPTTSIKGDLTNLTDSQLTTLIAVLREALTNIRKHSRANAVTISLSGERHHVKVTVTDDGCGFDPEQEMIRAAQDGHIGLASIHERVRTFGGRAQIESRPGGPTVISAVIPTLGTNGKSASRRGVRGIKPRVGAAFLRPAGRGTA